MAEALLKLSYGQKIFVDSCGVRRGADGTGADPFVMAVMEELGSNLETFRSKTFEDLEDGSFDLVISLTPEAQHKAVELARGRATEIEYWPTPDPTLVSGSRDTVLDAYRAVRDNLKKRIEARMGRPSTFGG